MIRGECTEEQRAALESIGNFVYGVRRAGCRVLQLKLPRRAAARVFGELVDPSPGKVTTFYDVPVRFVSDEAAR